MRPTTAPAAADARAAVPGTDVPDAGAAAPVRLARLRWWDVADVAALEADLFGPTAWSAELFWSELAAPGRGAWVARTADGALAGYAVAAAAGADADVQTIATAPWARGRGLGDALLVACEEHASALGATALLLEVDAGNAPARRLYARHGFEQLARRRDYYGPGADALVLRRRTSTPPGPAPAHDPTPAPADDPDDDPGARPA